MFQKKTWLIGFAGGSAIALVAISFVDGNSSRPPGSEPAAATVGVPWPDGFKPTACADDIKRLLEDWESRNNWLSAGTLEDGVGFGDQFRSPSRKFGTWIGISRSQSGISVARLASGSVTEVTWDSACGRTLEVLPEETPDADPSSAESVSDESLGKLVASGAKGVIYAWTPHMPYSVKAFEEAKAAAKVHGMEFVPVLDPQADEEFARAIVEAKGWDKSALKRMESNELAFRGMALHFPAALVFKGGELSMSRLPGYEPKQGYAHFFEAELAKGSAK